MCDFEDLELYTKMLSKIFGAVVKSVAILKYSYWHPLLRDVPLSLSLNVVGFLSSSPLNHGDKKKKNKYESSRPGLQ